MASTIESGPSEAVTGGGRSRHLPRLPKLPKFTRRRLLVLVAAVVIIVCVAVLLLFIFGRNRNPVVFSVDGEAYSPSQVTKLVQYPVDRGVSREAAAKIAYDDLKDQAAANKVGLHPSQDQIVAAANQLLGSSSAESKLSLNDPWVKLTAYDAALKAQLTSNGAYAGYSFIFWFGQHLEKGFGYTAPDYDNQTFIAQDRSYAQSRAQYYHQQLQNGKMKPADILKSILADPKLGIGYQTGSTANASTYFSTTETIAPLSQQVFYQPVADYIQEQTKPGLSAIQTGKVATIEQPKSSKDYADEYFSFVDLKIVQPNLKANFEQVLNKLAARYNGYPKGTS